MIYTSLYVHDIHLYMYMYILYESKYTYTFSVVLVEFNYKDSGALKIVLVQCTRG